MVYPLLINGAEAGKLTVTEDGLFTVFEASVPKQQGLVRLAVYGEGAEGYLGVMQPWSGGLYLRRRLSGNERRRLPQTIEYAAPAGERISGKEDADTLEKSEFENISGTGGNVTESISSDIPAPSPANTGEDETELIWYARPDGTLTAFDGERSIIALPTMLRRNAPDAVLRRISGRTYMLFRY